MDKRQSARPMARTVEVVILLALPILFHHLFPLRIILTTPYTHLGLALMALALALSIWAAMTFRKAGTGYQLHGKAPVLVTSGPFGFSRNPMYLAMVIWLVGLAVLLGSLTPFALPIFVLLLANFLIIPAEERRMEQILEGQYAKYRQRVRRWL